uniref:Tudor domain-containing protein n=1 Tax=Setaria digitata TaxID=48799 RepID=A0A915PGI9_9BILA
MVAISLPETIANFEGEISHVVVAGNETLTFIKPSKWREERKRISSKLQSLAQSLRKFKSLSAVKSGEVYITNVKGSLERSYIIRRPTPDTYSIYLIDKGMQCEVQFDDIYEFPAELLDFELFSCVCPVFVPSADQLSIYKAFIGHKCRCEVEMVSKSFVVLGYVRGRLLVENGDIYEDLQDIVYGKLANGLKSSGRGYIRSNILTEVSEGDTVSWTASGQMDDSSSGELTYRCSSTEKIAQKTSTASCISNKKTSLTPKKIRCAQEHGSYMDAELCNEYDTVKTEALFTQTAFKQYKPDVIPTVISVRFDKRDRMFDRFWVVNKSIFSTVEKLLKGSAKRLTGFPSLRQRLDDGLQVTQIPCIVRTRAESAYKAFYRAVPARFDARTKRFSIFLVDFGWFRWVLANDVIDISTMYKSDPIRNLPVAMIHCQEDATSVLHAKNLSKGANCYMRVKGCPAQDVYLVDLLESEDAMKDQIVGAVDSHCKFLSNMGGNGVLSLSKKLANETCQQQLMASMVLGTSSVADRNQAIQSQHVWPVYYPSPFSLPMMMPIALPMMMPMPIPDTNLPSFGHDHILKIQNSQMKSPEDICIPQSNMKDSVCSRNYTHRRSQDNTLQKREWFGSDFHGRNRVGDRAGNSTNESSDGISWENTSKVPREHRIFRKSFDNNSQGVRLTSWEKISFILLCFFRAIITSKSDSSSVLLPYWAVAADRAVRAHGSPVPNEQTTSQYREDKSNRA